MSRLEDYRGRFTNIDFERRDGILQVRLHTDGGPLKWGALDRSIHSQLGEAFYQIARDLDNRVVILTGTGDSFCDAMNYAELPTEPLAQGWPRLQREGQDLLMQLLDIPVPVIGAINGPAHIHAELLVLSDIVLASSRAEISDQAHFVHGVVPADGVQIIWPMLLGHNRARYFLLSGERITAQRAWELGVVGEVVAHPALLERAWQMAHEVAAKPIDTLRYTRAVFTQPFKRRMLDELGYGLALEGLAGIAAQSGTT
ncbi:enoyl-CoA hydratase/isomerase family protein (plasmid) [Paraburkholderia sprentiae WSM5005]|uniref:Enoyl-CoA hydratase/isomerase family protein n=1 Tax=Paraburkholderia sprentiae WSM5005 TaxID=754502 RepID=A0A1I9YTR5_9BURK|nr:enoyl-CoA hydratase/isomerase family protein [Paraburkholderia sprentiae]APA89591.1 enoyl-CoA hydratase/isomerase family protein [Paraburkholderia sprentiae WSM5005]